MVPEQIELEANKLLQAMWKNRVRLLSKQDVHPLDLLEPELAAKFLGVRFDYEAGLGRFGERGMQFEVAGFIDRQDRRIAVSLQFHELIIRFTGAHEIGHYILHPDRLAPHRDRPIKGLAKGTSKPRIEQEADRFAACLLAPSKLLRKAFIARFHSAPLRVDDSAAFWLSPDDPESIFDTDLPDVAYALASARSYAGKPFKSLAELFRVSPSTMAIRLQELRLIA